MAEETTVTRPGPPALVLRAIRRGIPHDLKQHNPMAGGSPRTRRCRLRPPGRIATPCTPPPGVCTPRGAQGREANSPCQPVMGGFPEGTKWCAGCAGSIGKHRGCARERSREWRTHEPPCTPCTPKTGFRSWASWPLSWENRVVEVCTPRGARPPGGGHSSSRPASTDASLSKLILPSS
jgi:hypothetical protein